MENLWTATSSKSDKIILIKNKSVYKGNPKSQNLNTCINRINQGEIPEDLFCLPFSYIQRVENNPNDPLIKFILNGKSEDELRIEDPQKKKEIFETLKNSLSHLQYEKKIPDLLNSIRKPLISIVIIALIFSATLYFCFQLDQGVRYELNGRQGLLGIALGLASLGYVKVSALFGGLLLIASLALKKKLNHRTEMEFLK